MDELLSLVRDTLTWLRPTVEVPAIKEPPSLPAAPSPVKNSVIAPQEKPQIIVAPPKKELPESSLLTDTYKKILSIISPRTKVLDKPPSDKLALEKKERWKKQIENQEALLIFEGPCHPLFYDLEQALNTHVMSTLLISFQELHSLENSKAKLILFENSLDIESLKKKFPKCRFVEMPPAASLASNPSLKRKLWQTIQNP